MAELRARDGGTLRLGTGGVSVSNAIDSHLGLPTPPTDSSYDDAALTAWAGRIVGQPWQQAYVYFKHGSWGRVRAARGRRLPQGAANTGA